MASVEIQYCVPCGHLDRAESLQRSILETYGQQVDRVSLVTGDSGVFTVTVDGDQIFDVDDDTFDETAIVNAVGDAT